MTITLYILGWLLSGFLAAWIQFKYHTEEEVDTTLGDVIFCMACGAIALVMMLPHLPIFKINRVIFKAKERK